MIDAMHKRQLGTLVQDAREGARIAKDALYPGTSYEEFVGERLAEELERAGWRLVPPGAGA